MKKNVYEHPLTERVAEIHADRLCAGSPSIAAGRDTPPEGEGGQGLSKGFEGGISEWEDNDSADQP